MSPLKATAYLKGIRARKRSKRTECPYVRECLVEAFLAGVRDYEQNPADCEYFLRNCENIV